MTLAGIKSTRNELEKIQLMFPRPPKLSPEEEAFLASLTPAEVEKISAILIRADNGKEPTLEEIRYLSEIEARPVPPMPPIDRAKPRCRSCGRQPVNEHGFCAICFEPFAPHAIIEQRDCEHCEFALTGNAAKLKHVPCRHLERGGFRP